MTDTPAPIPDDRYSCLSSLNADEPIWAHATRVDAWLALGYNQPWGRKALPESDLSPSVKQRLIDFQADGSNRRVQFIKRRQGWAPDEIPLLLARCDVEVPVLRRMSLTSYQDLLELDLAALLDEPVPPEQIAPPTFLICTNGRRDLCCARYGMAVYQAFARLAPDRAWRTTHLGGHRFSPTSVLLPYGLHYGRFSPNDAEDLLAFTDAGRVSLGHLRGRSSYPAPVQAAAHRLRELERLDGIQDLRLVQSDEIGSGKWRVRFKLARGDRDAELTVTEVPEAFRVYKTTGDAEPAWVEHFDVERVA